MPIIENLFTCSRNNVGKREKKKMAFQEKEEEGMLFIPFPKATLFSY
jgi:hypothetical protein